MLGEDDFPRMVRSRHVTFHESRFPSAPFLSSYMDEQNTSDTPYFSEDDTIAPHSSELLVYDIVEDLSGSEICKKTILRKL